MLAVDIMAENNIVLRLVSKMFSIFCIHLHAISLLDHKYSKRALNYNFVDVDPTDTNNYFIVGLYNVFII